jgi:hypothetical protein
MPAADTLQVADCNATRLNTPAQSVIVPEPLIHPPKPPLAFSVGVIGHRPERLQHADRAQLGGLIRKILEAARSEVERSVGELRPYYDDQPLVLRAISPLAEGTDRIFAKAALELGYELCCPLPFPQAVFEQTFITPKDKSKGIFKDWVNATSVAEFRALLARAAAGTGLTRFELPGSPETLKREENRHWGYERCGRLVFQHSDLLMVVWDGEHKNRRGGTDQQLEEARQSGIPIVLIDAHAPHAAWVLKDDQPLPEMGQTAINVDPAGREALLEQVRGTVREVLTLPHDLNRMKAKKGHNEETIQTTTLDDFYAERKPG